MGKIFDKSNYDRLSPFEAVQRFATDIRHCVQRIRYGFCNEDVWGMRTWFCRVVPDMLDTLRKYHHSVPDKIINQARFGGSVAEASAEWERILKKIAFLIRESDEATAERKIENPYDLRTQTEAHLRFEKRKLAYREKCRQEGMRLFMYWFNDLWD